MEQTHGANGTVLFSPSSVIGCSVYGINDYYYGPRITLPLTTRIEGTLSCETFDKKVKELEEKLARHEKTLRQMTGMFMKSASVSRGELDGLVRCDYVCFGCTKKLPWHNPRKCRVLIADDRTSKSVCRKKDCWEKGLQWLVEKQKKVESGGSK